MCDYTDLYSGLANVRTIVFTSTDSKKALQLTRAWFKRLDADYKAYIIVQKLKRYWPLCPETLLLAHANTADLPWCVLMQWILDNGGKIDASVAIRFWRRLKALGQYHIISYLRQSQLLERIKQNPEITPEIILGLCFTSEETLKTFNSSWTNPHSVDLALRGYLGCSMAADIRVAFKKWIARNHPDKGGDTDRFALVNAAYQEWEELDLHLASPPMG